MDFEPTIRRTNFDDVANANYWNSLKRSGHSHPEQDLMFAVLKDALLNYRKHLHNPKKSLRGDRDWFFAKDRDRLFSFESVCGVLGFNPQYIRKRLRLWEQEAQHDRTRICSKTVTTDSPNEKTRHYDGLHMI